MQFHKALYLLELHGVLLKKLNVTEGECDIIYKPENERNRLFAIIL